MRWEPAPALTKNSYKIQKRFALIPTLVNDEVVWLEFYYVKLHWCGDWTKFCDSTQREYIEWDKQTREVPS